MITDEKTLDRIDRYVRGKMAARESLDFEQEALNNPELFQEAEMTYRLKRSLTDRQQKLFQTAKWGNRRHNVVIRTIGVFSVAAVIVWGVFLMFPSGEVSYNDTRLADASISQEHAKLHKEVISTKETIKIVRRSIAEGNDEEAVQQIQELESTNIIPSLSETSSNHLTMSHSIDNEAGISTNDAYELHWLKICSLIKIGKTAQAFNELKAFASIDGRYQKQADSLLKELNTIQP